MSFKNSILVSISLLLLIFSQVWAEDTDWTTWRGPHGNGTYDSKAWTPAALQGTLKTDWKINVGKGFSAVAVKGNVFYTMGNKNGTDYVYCFTVDKGTAVWEYSYPCLAGDYNGPRATPVLEGNSLYTLSREGHLFCFKADDGKILWQKHLAKDFGASPPTWSFAGTPVISGNMLLINANVYGLAVNKNDGKLIWSSPKGRGGYSSAVIYAAGKKSAVSFFGEKAIFGVDPETGKKLWQFAWETDYDVHVAEPVITGNTLFFSSGYGRGCALLDITDNKVKKIWENTVMASQFSSFIYSDGCVFGSNGNVGESSATLRCLELKSGTLKWEKKLGAGSLIASNGYLLYFTERGKLYIAKMDTTKYEEIASAQVLNGTCWTAPVLFGSKLFLRNDRGDMVCLNLSGK